MSENSRQPVVIPPKYVNVPSRLVYDKGLPEQVRNTYIQLYGLSWQSYGHLEITWEELIELTGKSRTILYGHLAVLGINGILTNAGQVIGDAAVLAVFPDPSEADPDWTVAPFRVDWARPGAEDRKRHPDRPCPPGHPRLPNLRAR